MNILNPACVSILAAAELALQIAVLPISFAGPHGLDIDEDSDRAFVACDGRAVVALDMKNKGHEIGSVSIAGEPDVIWNNQNKGRLYCAIGKPGVIDVIDTHTMTLAEEIHTEEGAHTFAFDNIRQLLYAFLPDSCCVQFTRKPEMVRRMNEIDYQYSYASPDPVPAGSSGHFDVTLVQSDFANVVPKYFKLCFDW